MFQKFAFVQTLLICICVGCSNERQPTSAPIVTTTTTTTADGLKKHAIENWQALVFPMWNRDELKRKETLTAYTPTIQIERTFSANPTTKSSLIAIRKIDGSADPSTLANVAFEKLSQMPWAPTKENQIQRLIVAANESQQKTIVGVGVLELTIEPKRTDNEQSILISWRVND